eukprot:TRINITY_DN3295_c0_g1_i1.p1 TRINITY_DN3295_c0_g1~~TRINITY_DN3295_c0_g1_i1.p1  ORF type:complete len:104 (-),score=14.15 TRINITY_DN3295_c0_g1_i1:94-405(-)
MAKGLQFVSDKVRGSVLETKKMIGIGNVCDVILANGELRAGDEIVLGGLNGAFVTKIKSILLPSTLQEMRVKGEYRSVPVALQQQMSEFRQQIWRTPSRLQKF